MRVPRIVAPFDRSSRCRSGPIPSPPLSSYDLHKSGHNASIIHMQNHYSHIIRSDVAAEENSQ
jgi:hypothetical protein